MPCITVYRGKISKLEKVKKKATIVVLGRTGEGKSSLLNAIMEKENLLPPGCFGACTSVITQVEANLHDSNYIAEIEFISEEEWNNLIPSLDKNDQTCKDMMTALFGADAEDMILEELKKKDDYAKLERLLSTKKIISERSSSTFANKITFYITHSDEGGCYWPIVKTMTIKIPNCQDLLEHIVFVDLPGSEDCNKIRDNLWKSKLRECSAVWIVSNIKRAKSDRNPWAILDHCIEDLGPGGECKHINFICTKTDEMKPAEYLRSEQLAKKDILRDGQESKERFISDVFTVNSTAYFDKKSNLKPAETEIPRLQNVIRSLNKSISEKFTRDYINEAKGILSLIQSFQPDEDKKMTKRGVQMKLEKSLEKKLKILDGQFDSLYEILERCLSKGVEESVKSFVKTTRGVILPVKKNKLCYNTYQAMCRKNGCHWPQNWNEPIDFNKSLIKHMYDNINAEFELMFPVDANDKKGKSMQDYLDKFNIFQRVSPSASMQYHFENFIKTQMSPKRFKS
ncbi:nuclear GTPase SLIP-GC-like [Triplophysa dalaica]|uniref:nuclear GTPase SLIP-GC-like n=1 Tax=Triplophysa dalaica TaxID=1582913 RepID=UPI0024DF61C5|nr:nuclear GTPase SLIP-GC-like [Triplophysa dalaica]